MHLQIRSKQQRQLAEVNRYIFETLEVLYADAFYYAHKLFVVWSSEYSFKDSINLEFALDDIVHLYSQMSMRCRWSDNLYQCANIVKKLVR